MDFADVVAGCRALAGQMRARGCAVDALVGVTRGGWVPARVLSSLLGVRRMYSIGLHYADAERRRLVCYDDPAPFIAPASTLLVVEDCLETGQALNVAREHLGAGGHRVWTAALFMTKRTVFIPDFCVDRVDDPPVFPWELPESRV